MICEDHRGLDYDECMNGFSGNEKGRKKRRIGYVRSDCACMLFVIDDDPRVKRLLFAKNYPSQIVTPLCSFLPSRFYFLFSQLSPNANNNNMMDDLLDSFWPALSNQQFQQYFYLHSDALSQESDSDLIGGVEPNSPPIIDSPIESQTTPQAGQTEDIAQTFGVETPKRVNNTIFRTGVSCYRKSIVKHIKCTPHLNPLLGVIQQVCKEKNMGVFPKLNFMVRWMRLDPVAQIWMKRKEQMLAKKKQLMGRKKYSAARLGALTEVVRNMNDCIKEEDFDKAFKRYWGKFRQLSKHLTCLENVLEFREKFKKDNLEEQMLKKRQEKEKKERKATKKTKTIKKTKKNTDN